MGSAIICEQCQQIDKQNIDLNGKSTSSKAGLQKRQTLARREAKQNHEIEIRIVTKQKDGSYQVLYVDGGCYREEMKMGMRHGEGVHIFGDGIQYNGMWQFDKGHGHGVLKTDNFQVQGQFEGNRIVNGRMKVQKDRFTEIYEGQFKDFMYHGSGILTVIGHSRYQGNFVNHKKYGTGKIVYEAGCSYEGQFVNNAFDGKGRYKNEQFQYTGQFKKNKMDGKGTCKWSNGSTYVGEFVNGVREGQGEFMNQRGVVYSGVWRRGKMFDSVYTFGRQEQ